MSRHRYIPEGWPPGFELFLGFDPALETFYAQLFDRRRGGEDHECVMLWLTPRPREILEPDQLIWNVNRGIVGRLPIVKLSAAMRDRLTRDRKREDKGDWLDKPRQPRRRRQAVCALDFKPGEEA